MNSKIVTIVLIILGLFCGALITRNGNIAFMAMPFLTYLGIGILRTPPEGNIILKAQRLVKKLSINVPNTAEVCVTIQNQSGQMLLLRLADPLQPLMEITDGKLKQEMLLQSGEQKNYKYSFRSIRGSYVWDYINAVVTDPLGLIENVIQIPAKGTFQINPQIKKYKAITFRPQSTIHAPGSIPARLGGSGTDFWGIREYHQGDSLRLINWRLKARYPHKLFTKEFEQEEIADIGFILDARKKTNVVVGKESLFEHSLSAAASIADMFLNQGHRLSMVIYGEKIVNIFPGYGKQQLNRIMRNLATAQVGQDLAIDSLDYIPIRIFPNRSLIIVISPLAPKEWSLFPILRARGHNVLLICPDTFDFSYGIIGKDFLTLLAMRAAKLKRCLKLNKISRLRISVIDWKVEQLLLPLVRNALTNIRGQRQI